ncbi:MAG: hypothetical protein ABJH20_09870 [Rhizobiaceae bacterium]
MPDETLDDANRPPKNSNSLLSEHAKQLDDIRVLIRTSDDFHDRHLEKLKDALVNLFQLGLALIKEDLIENFYKNNGERWGEKAKNNPFHALVTIAFESNARDELLSKYRGILRYAHFAGHTPEKLKGTLDDIGIEKTYKAAVDFFNRDFESDYDETEDERFHRAVKAVSGNAIGKQFKLPQNQLPKNTYRGYSTAVVRVDGDSVQLVDFLPNQSSNLIAENVAKLVKPMGARVRTKLAEKDMYWMFSFADIFSRLVLDQTQAQHWEMERAQRQRLKQRVLEGDFDQAEFVKSIKKQVAKEKKKRKFKGQTLLHISHVSGTWCAKTLSNYPTFPVVEFRFAASKEVELNPDWDLAMTEKQAGNFSKLFLQFANWDLSQTESAHKLKSVSDNALDVRIDNFNVSLAEKEEWRSASTKTTTAYSFTSSETDLYEIWNWREKHKGRKPFERNKNFPKIMELVIIDDEVIIRFPKHKEYFLRLGSLQRDDAEAPSKTLQSPVLGYITFDLLHKVTNVARDYSLQFSGCLLQDRRGAVAIQFDAIGFHCDLSIVLPLTSSMQGDTYEVTEFFGS